MEVGDERVGMMLVLMVYFFMKNEAMSRDVLKSSGKIFFLNFFGISSFHFFFFRFDAIKTCKIKKIDGISPF